MSQLDRAFQRLDGAVARLESAIAGQVAAGAIPDNADLEAERDRLSDEVRDLRARAEEDAQLRAEAAAALRDALYDLRGAIGQEPEEVRRNA